MYLFTTEFWRVLTSVTIYVSHMAACKGLPSKTRGQLGLKKKDKCLKHIKGLTKKKKSSFITVVIFLKIGKYLSTEGLSWWLCLPEESREAGQCKGVTRTA